PNGLYEEIISESRSHQLADPALGLLVQRSALDSADSHASLADYLRNLIAAALDDFDGDGKLASQLILCNQIVRLLHSHDADHAASQRAVMRPGEMLLSISHQNPGEVTQPQFPERPDTPLSFGCLLTGTRLDPSLVSQLKKEIRTADQIDIL